MQLSHKSAVSALKALIFVLAPVPLAQLAAGALSEPAIYAAILAVLLGYRVAARRREAGRAVAVPAAR